MKNLMFLLLLSFVMVSCKQQKLGFVDNSKLINEYQEKIDTDESIKAKVEDFRRVADSLQQAFQLEVKDAEIRARKMSQEALQKLSKELQDKDQMLSQRLQFQQNQITQESRSKNDTLVKKVRDFVEDYGKKNGYTFILGSNEAGSVMFGEQNLDLTEAVLEELNAAYKKDDE